MNRGCEYLPILTDGVKMKGRVYTRFVRSCIIYSNENWPMKVENEAKLDRNEMSMLGWMCGFTWKDKRKYDTEVSGLLGLDPVSLTIKRVDCGGLDKLNVRMMQAGSSNVCT